MVTHKSPSELLLAAYRDHQIAINEQEIATLLDDTTVTGQDNARWIADHLQEDTLLTRDEFSLFILLEKRGIFSEFQHSVLPTTRVFSDTEIRSAIEALEVSTADLQKQILTLKSQHAAADRFVTENSKARNNEQSASGYLARRYVKEFQHLHTKIEDLRRDMGEKLPMRKEQVAQRINGLSLSAMAELKEHDRIFSHAEGLIAQLTSQEAVGVIERRADKLTSLVSSLTAEHIYNRLERLYRETTSEKSDIMKDNIESDESEAALIENDLGSLFPEIEILAQMAIEQQFRAPVQYELYKDRGNSLSRLLETLNLTLGLVKESGKSTQFLTDKLLDQHSSLVTLRNWSQFYTRDIQKDIDRRITPKPSSQGNSSVNTSQSRSRGSQETGDASSKQLSSLKALPSLLRRIGIQSEQDSAEPEKGRALASLFEKEDSTKGGLQHLYKNMEGQLMEDLVITDKANQIFLRNLQVDSNYALSLTKGRKTQITDLADQIQSVQEKIEKLQFETESLNDRSREKFLDRWS